jgi:hypothetical protein
MLKRRAPSPPPPTDPVKDQEQDARLAALEASVNALTTRVTELEGRMIIVEQQLAVLEEANSPRSVSRSASSLPPGEISPIWRPWLTTPVRGRDS